MPRKFRDIKYRLVIGLIFFAVSCTAVSPPSPPPTAVYPTSDAPVRVRVLSAESFRIENHTSAPIYYQIFPSAILPLIDWAPCSTIEECMDVRILPGEHLEMPFVSVVDTPGEQVALFWWQMQADLGEPDPAYFFPQLIEFSAK